MNNIKIFKDTFAINDSDFFVKGYVIIKNDKDEIVFSKKNMIVNDGRKYILDLFLRNALNKIDGLNSISKYGDYKLKYCYVGGNDFTTEINTTYPLVSNKLFKKYNLLKTNSFEISEKDRFIKFTININGSDFENQDYVILDLGLLLGKTSNDDDLLLFSRISLDALPVTSDSNYVVHYYLYF